MLYHILSENKVNIFSPEFNSKRKDDDCLSYILPLLSPSFVEITSPISISHVTSYVVC